MANVNGSTTQTQQLEADQVEQIERAIIGAAKARPTVSRGEADDLTSMIAALAMKARDIGRDALEHGKYLHKLCNDFADILENGGGKFTGDVLASERRKLGDLERVLGKLVG